MKKQPETDPSSPNSDSINRLESVPDSPDNLAPPGVKIPKKGGTSYDPWDLDAARNRQKKERRVKVVTTYRVASKPRPGSFFRVCADPAYQIDCLLYVEKEESGMSGDTYFVDWEFADEVAESEWAVFFQPARLYLAIERHSTKPYVHYVKYPRDGEKDNTWWESSRTIIENSLQGWVQPYNTGSNYDFRPPVGTPPDPVWPDTPFGEILRVAFKDKLIKGWGHEVMKALLGA